MSFGDATENALLDRVFGAAAYTPPATLHLALFTVAPTDAGGGTEVSGNGYSRVAIPNDATNFPAAAGGAKSNGQEIVFPQATADWGTIVAWALMSAATGGSIVFRGAMTPNQQVVANATPKLAAGDLDITLD